MKAFGVTDYTSGIITEPARFGCDNMIIPGSRKQRVALNVSRLAYWLMPGYLWLLCKPR